MNDYGATSLMLAIFMLYVFVETKIFLAIWIAFLNATKGIWLIVDFDKAIYKGIVIGFVVTIFIGYIYKFRHVVFRNEKFDNEKLLRLKNDKKLQQRILAGFLVLLIIDIILINII